MLYILLGPPASGKGTQAELLARSFGIPHISTGAVLRELRETRPEVAELIDSGKVVSDDCIREIYQAVLQRYPDDLILDGAIRSRNQVEILLDYWQPNDICIIWITIPDSVIKERSLHRDKTAEEKRPDDRLDIIDDRIDYYHQTEAMIIEQIKLHRLRLVTVDGNQSVQAVHTAIRKAIQ